MTRLTTLALTTLALVSPAPAIAQHANPPNAADDYREAFAAWEKLPESDREILASYEYTPGARVSPEVRAALSRAQPALDAFRTGGDRDFVDWGITYEKGPGTLLPHLSPLRNGARLLALDAHVRLAQGDARGAAESIAASIHMSDHATDDPVLISTLVGVAMFRHIDSSVLQNAIGSGALGAGEAGVVLDSIDDILHDDPFQLTGSLIGEREGMAGWMIDNFSMEGGKESFLDEYAPMFAASGLQAGIVADLAPLSQQGFEVAMQQYDLALADMGDAIQQDDLGQAMADVRDIIDKALRGAYGPLAPHMIPAMDRAIEQVLNTYERIEDLREDLQTIVNDPENGALKVRNAALWYLRAIEKHEQIDRHVWDLIEANPSRLDETQRETLAAALPDTEPIIAELLAAVEIERCDFDLQNTWDMLGLRADLSHVDGMIRNGHLLRAHVTALLRGASEENGDRAAELLRAAAKMSEHLATDHQLRSVRACCDILEAGFDVVEAVQGDGNAAPITLDPAAIAALHSAASRNALQYDTAMLRYRDRSSGWLVRTFIDRGGRRDTIAAELAELAPQSIEPRAITLQPLAFNDAVTALRELDRLAERAALIARTPAHSSEIEIEIEALKLGYAETWPADLAAWILDPIAQTAIAVEHVGRRGDM